MYNTGRAFKDKSTYFLPAAIVLFDDVPVVDRHSQLNNAFSSDVHRVRESFGACVRAGQEAAPFV